MSKDKEITKWIHCNSCNRSTEHLKVAEYSRCDSSEPDELGYTVDWQISWNIWECRGCKELLGEKIFIFSEDFDFNGKPVVNREVFPPRDKEFLKANEYNDIPEKLDKLYKEVIKSYNNFCDILCCMGLRALIEGICVDKGISGEVLKDKIDNASFIPINIRKNLHSFRFLGNDAAHRLDIPKDRKNLILAINVIEDILNVSYELDYKSTMIYRKIMEKKKNPIPSKLPSESQAE